MTAEGSSPVEAGHVVERFDKLKHLVRHYGGEGERHSATNECGQRKGAEGPMIGVVVVDVVCAGVGLGQYERFRAALRHFSFQFRTDVFPTLATNWPWTLLSAER